MVTSRQIGARKHAQTHAFGAQTHGVAMDGNGRTQPTDARIEAQAHGASIMPLWLTRAEALAQLGVAPRTLSKYVQRGLVESVKAGRERRYRIISEPQTGARKQAHAQKAHGAPIAQGRQSIPPKDARPSEHGAPIVRQLIEALTQAHQEVGRHQARVAQLEAQLTEQAATIEGLESEVEQMRELLTVTKRDGKRRRLVASSGRVEKPKRRRKRT